MSDVHGFFSLKTGSPYHPKIVDPSCVRLSGHGGPLDRHNRIPLEVDREKHLPFDASHAGPGRWQDSRLKVKIERSWIKKIIQIFKDRNIYEMGT